MRRAAAFAAAVALLLLLAPPASSADAEFSFVIGTDRAVVSAGEMLAVSLTVKNNAGQSYDLYGMQTYIRFDPDYFEFVEDSVQVYQYSSGGQNKDLFRASALKLDSPEINAIFVNRASLTAHNTEPSVVAVTFKIRAKKAGTSVIRNETMEMLRGSEKLTVTSTDASVTIIGGTTSTTSATSTTAALPPGGGGNPGIVPPPPPSGDTITISSETGQGKFPAVYAGNKASVGKDSAGLEDIICPGAGMVRIDAAGGNRNTGTVVLTDGILPLLLEACRADSGIGLELVLSAGSLTIDNAVLSSLFEISPNILELEASLISAGITAPSSGLLADREWFALFGIDVEIKINGINTPETGAGMVKAAIPFAPDAALDPEGYCFVKAGGSLSENGDEADAFNPVTGALELVCGEFGRYNAFWYNPIPFTDVKYGDWYYEAVKFAFKKNIMVGISAREFGPEAPLSRAMIVAILWRLEGRPPAPPPPFNDLTADWYIAAAGWAAECGIVNGYGNGIFAPGDDVTREQMAVIFKRYAEYKNLNFNMDNRNAQFTDMNEASSWAVDSIIWAAAAGLMQGKGAGVFDPAAGATRAETAVIFKRLAEKAH